MLSVAKLLSEVTSALRELPEVTAIKLDGKVYRGTLQDGHYNLYVRALQSLYRLPDFQTAQDYLDNNFDDLDEKHELDDGFLTNKGRFVSREEAFGMFNSSEQRKLKSQIKGSLASEDLRRLYGGEFSAPAKPIKDTALHPYYKGRTGD